MNKAQKEKKKKQNAYHRFFEDYTEKKVIDPKTGKSKIEHVYSGWYYQPMLEEEEDRILRNMFVRNYFLALLAFIISGLLPADGLDSVLLIAACACELITLIFMSFCVYDIKRAGRKVEIRVYKQFKRLGKLAFSCMLGFLVGAVAAVIGIVLCITQGQKSILICLVQLCMQCAGAVLMFQVYRREEKLLFDRIKSDQDAGEGSYLIN